MDRKYVISSMIYAILGLTLGIVMAAAKNHAELVTHAHIMLVGFVMAFIYGLCHRLWLDNDTSALSIAQFYLHQTGTAVMSAGLFLLYGNHIELEVIDPVLALASLAILAGMLLMAILFARSWRKAANGG